ncbi:MAG: hypothetical protein ACOY0T_23875 [Myxococcota bacterium]
MAKRLGRFVGPLAAIWVLFSASCGGNAEAVSGAASCPAAPPAQGSACSGDAQCSYGSSPDFACRLLLVCEHGGWVQFQAGCEGSDLPACPQQEPTSGTACDVEDGPNLSCRYGAQHERNCVCHTCSRFDYCEPGVEPGWHCKGPPEADGCPPLPPNVGRSCPLLQLECRYGFACINEVVARCTDRGWQLADGTACPEGA